MLKRLDLIRIDLVGQRFGRLTVIAFESMSKSGARWNVRCDCGMKRIIRRKHLTGHATQSCGCFRKECARIRAREHIVHGMSGTLIYQLWSSMKARCTNPRDPGWRRYGGRGITVCRRWRTFDNFLADMGTKPAGKSIDRLNNDGDYEPSNCRWATPKQQANNRRTNGN